jgi:hypothetical protein
MHSTHTVECSACSSATAWGPSGVWATQPASTSAANTLAGVGPAAGRVHEAKARAVATARRAWG